MIAIIIINSKEFYHIIDMFLINSKWLYGLFRSNNNDNKKNYYNNHYHNYYHDYYNSNNDDIPLQYLMYELFTLLSKINYKNFSYLNGNSFIDN